MNYLDILAAKQVAYTNAFERKQAELEVVTRKLKDFDNIQVFVLYKDKNQIDLYFAERDALLHSVSKLSKELGKLDTALRLINEELCLLS